MVASERKVGMTTETLGTMGGAQSIHPARARLRREPQQVHVRRADLDG